MQSSDADDPSVSPLHLVIIACRSLNPLFIRRRPSFSGHRFPAVEHSATELNFSAVTDCYDERPEGFFYCSLRCVL